MHAEQQHIPFACHHWNIRTLLSLACAAQGSVKALLTLTRYFPRISRVDAAVLSYYSCTCTHCTKSHTRAREFTHGSTRGNGGSCRATVLLIRDAALQRWSDPAAAAAAAGSRESVQGDRRGRMTEWDEDKKWQNASESDGGPAEGCRNGQIGMQQRSVAWNSDDRINRLIAAELAHRAHASKG